MSRLISRIVRETATENRVTAMAFFLHERVGTVCGSWSGSMRPEEQRYLFGRYIGSGFITVDGHHETVSMRTHDLVETFRMTWAEIDASADRQPFPLWNPFSGDMDHYNAIWAKIKTFEKRDVTVTLVDGTKVFVQKMRSSTCTRGVGIQGERFGYGYFYGPEDFVSVELHA